MTDRDNAGPKAPRPVGATPLAGERTGRAPELDDKLQAHIGRHLRALYDEIVDQPVPDRFVQLLEDLERKKAERG